MKLAMAKTPSSPKEAFTDENEFLCSYCESPENVESNRVDSRLELKCTGCGRYGDATLSDGSVKPGKFFEYTPSAS